MTNDVSGGGVRSGGGKKKALVKHGRYLSNAVIHSLLHTGTGNRIRKR